MVLYPKSVNNIDEAIDAHSVILLEEEQIAEETARSSSLAEEWLDPDVCVMFSFFRDHIRLNWPGWRGRKETFSRLRPSLCSMRGNCPELPKYPLHRLSFVGSFHFRGSAFGSIHHHRLFGHFGIIAGTSCTPSGALTVLFCRNIQCRNIVFGFISCNA